MKVTRTIKPLSGERIIGVRPTMKPETEAGWQRRLHLFTGRSLSDKALTTEQNSRAGRLATCGQLLSPGVVRGLEIDIETVTIPRRGDVKAQTQHYLRIAPGFGLTANGEDVVLPSELRVDVLDLRVYGPAALFKSGIVNDEEGSEESTATVLPARLDAPLRELLQPGKNLNIPMAGILVLQPIVAEVVGEFDATDPCEQDPSSYAFEDWQLVDGARLIYYAWPTDWLPLPIRDGRWRNRLAYSIFFKERELHAGQLMPWAEIGVPIGLIAFAVNEADGDAETRRAWNPLFVDRYSVVRAGGKPRQRTPLGYKLDALQRTSDGRPLLRDAPLPATGNPFLFQSQLQQFVEQIADPTLANLPINEVAGQFNHLPPAGLLPPPALEFTFQTTPAPLTLAATKFFPASWKIDAVPVPAEQLDVAMEASAALEPFTMAAVGEQVQMLVPVPQAFYEPDLLRAETVAPEFARAIDQFKKRKTELEFRRKDVRTKGKLIGKNIRGKETTYPANDPDGTLELNPAEDAFGTKGAANQLSAEAFDDLKAALKRRASFLEAEWPNLEKLGLEQFIAHLERLVQTTNDKIDLSFLNIHTDIYRIRQAVLGNTAATRLATMPTLATLAQGESTTATREEISKFAQRITATPPPAQPTLFGAAAEETSAAAFTEEAPAAIFGDRFTTPLLGDLAIKNLDPIAKTKNLDITLKESSTVAALKADTQISESALFLRREFNESDVIGQTPIIGQFNDPHRTITIAERIKLPESEQSQQSAVARKADTVSDFASHKVTTDNIVSNLYLDDLDLPGIQIKEGDKSRPATFADARKDATLIGRILGNEFDPIPEKADEGKVFSVGIRALDHSVGMLRRIEGRVQVYRLAIQDCQQALARLRDLENRVNLRLTELEEMLAEATHDLTVAQALYDEENDRVRSINQRRQEIIRTHVRFLAWQRPRHNDLLLPMPVRNIEPGLTEAPVPVCLNQEVTTPPDLRRMVDLLREVPLKWFPRIHLLLDKLDRLESLQRALSSARVRAQVQTQTTSAVSLINASAGTYTKALTKVFSTQQTVVAVARNRVSNLDTQMFTLQNWQVTRDLARDHLSVGDLIDAGHGNSEVARLAARELDQITHVATCLYESFGRVLPEIRLTWAERLSQYDAPINLRSLTSLPRWGEKKADGEDLIPFVERRAMQILVDWLYQQIEALESDAIAMMHDIVRVCLLLASHAPVKQIIGGHVRQATTVSPGSRIELTVDPAKIRVGLHVWMQAANNLTVRAVVDDLSTTNVTARVVQLIDPNPVRDPAQVKQSVRLEEKTPVQFTEPVAFEKTAFKIYNQVR